MRKTFALTVLPFALIGAAGYATANPPAKPAEHPTEHPNGDHGHGEHDNHHGEKPAH